MEKTVKTICYETEYPINHGGGAVCRWIDYALLRHIYHTGRADT